MPYRLSFVNSKQRDPDKRALEAQRHAQDVHREASQYGSAREAPGPWLVAAEAWEVAADALEEAGWTGPAEYANATAHNIYTTIRYAYAPIESRELYRQRRRRTG